MRAPRFPSALAAAFAFHAVIVIAMARAPRPARATAGPPAELEIDLVASEPVEPSLPPLPEAPREAVPVARAGVAQESAHARAASRAVPVAALVASAEPALAAGAAPPMPSARVAQLDLGVGTYWKTAALAPVGSAGEGQNALPAPSPLDRSLGSGADARTLALGLGPAGPVVSAAHEAASPDIAPDVGDAVFEVESDASGKVIAVRLASSRGAERERWGDVARELARLLRSKTIRVPRGSHGALTQIRIVAERTLPAGEKHETHAGAVPDDVPGADPACVGEGLERRCAAGMPLGGTTTLGDLSNIGAKRSRIVHVHVLGETTL